MPVDVHPLSGAIKKLANENYLSATEQEAFSAIPYRISDVESGAYILRQGNETDMCFIILMGLTFSNRITGNGSRQIIAINMRDDIVNVQSGLTNFADHNIQALSHSKIAYISYNDIFQVVNEYPAIGRALWRNTGIQLSIMQEWAVNMGRKSAKSRICHFICELFIRQKKADLMRKGTIAWPMTQDQIADTLGLTAVHVSRILKILRTERLIKIDKRVLTIMDWDALRDAGDFRSAYLHYNEDLGVAES
ncbi:Crp/Fnr family transcriptional regulator [Sphingomonas sp. PAMC 26605]|uniref:Crp/Fnr family transcriptional regulator n=1 Tax=Sphingomonas sp. PAMC 26605 TaxID=1112214 RepID=UPI00026CAD16|nr:Crp/Fnr family transcriptional regulator [Sphingomonas sp. PAMC 26605]